MTDRGTDGRKKKLIQAAMRFVKNWERSTTANWLLLDDDYRAMAKAARALQQAMKK